MGLTRVWPVLAPFVINSSMGAPSNCPLSFPLLARNSSIIWAFQSLTLTTMAPLRWDLPRRDELWRATKNSARQRALITPGARNMTKIATVRGPLDTAELGETLMHEHVFVLTPEIQQNYPGDWDEEERVADAVAKLRALREVGVRTIVDLTVIGLGRYIPRIQRVNEQVDINIVA